MAKKRTYYDIASDSWIFEESPYDGNAELYTAIINKNFDMLDFVLKSHNFEVRNLTEQVMQSRDLRILEFVDKSVKLPIDLIMDCCSKYTDFPQTGL